MGDLLFFFFYYSLWAPSQSSSLHFQLQESRRMLSFDKQDYLYNVIHFIFILLSENSLSLALFQASELILLF